MMNLRQSYILLQDLKFHAFHGVLPQERKTGNDYLVSLRIKYDVMQRFISWFPRRCLFLLN